jgi:hypothetical protein
VTGSHTYADEGSFALSTTVTRTADNTTVTLAGANATVAEADVLATSGTSGPFLTDGAVSGVLGNFTDSNPGTPLSDLTATINWGDGPTSPGTLSLSNGIIAVSGAHTYSTDGAFQASVTLSDDGAGTASASAQDTIIVAASTPFSVPNQIVSQAGLASAVEGTAVIPVVAEFTDITPLNTNVSVNMFSAAINWGDGTTSLGTVIDEGVIRLGIAPFETHRFAISANPPHTYADEGSYALSVGIIGKGVGPSGSDISGTIQGTVTVADADVLAAASSSPIVAPVNTLSYSGTPACTRRDYRPARQAPAVGPR